MNPRSFARIELVFSARICIVSCRPTSCWVLSSRSCHFRLHTCWSAPCCNRSSFTVESGKTVFPEAVLLKYWSGVKTLDAKADVQTNHSYQIALRCPRCSVPRRTWKEGVPSALKRVLLSPRGASCNLKPSCTAVFGALPFLSFKSLWDPNRNSFFFFFFNVLNSIKRLQKKCDCVSASSAQRDLQMSGWRWTFPPFSQLSQTPNSCEWDAPLRSTAAGCSSCCSYLSSSRRFQSRYTLGNGPTTVHWVLTHW